MAEMKEAVLVDGVRTPNFRSHAQKGWARNLRPDELLTYVYKALFERNPQVKPEEIEAVFCGTANQTGMQNDIARLGWLASGMPESVATNGVNQQCPSGMSCVEHACRAIIADEGDIYIASGVEDMMNVPMAMGMDFPPRITEYYNPAELPMGPTAEKIAEVYNVSRADAELMAYHSHLKAAAARDAGKFANEIVPVKALDDDGNEFVADKDQWIRDNPSLEQMAGMNPAFRPDGVVTAAISSPLTTGACAALFMSREKADELGLSYYVKYAGGAMAGCDPTIMGIGENAPFENINVWGGALALGHPLGESGCRIVITLSNVMKTDFPDARYGVATLCGGFGNANATLWEKV